MSFAVGTQVCCGNWADHLVKKPFGSKHEYVTSNQAVRILRSNPGMIVKKYTRASSLFEDLDKFPVTSCTSCFSAGAHRKVCRFLRGNRKVPRLSDPSESLAGTRFNEYCLVMFPNPEENSAPRMVICKKEYLEVL